MTSNQRPQRRPARSSGSPSRPSGPPAGSSGPRSGRPAPPAGGARPERTGPSRPDRPERVEKDGDRRSPSATSTAIPLGDLPRDLVYRKLARQAQNFPLLLIDELNDDAPAMGALSPRDRAFAHAVYDAVITRWITLEHLLQPCLNQPVTELEARMRAVVMAGAAQLLILDKVPAYAAINHAVEWAKERIRPGAGAMVNAVLRKVARLRPPSHPTADADAPRPRYTGARNELPVGDGSAIILAADLLPEEDLARLSVAASLPMDLIYAWSRTYPVADVRRLAMHTLASPAIILYTGHATAPFSQEHAAVLTPHRVPGHHVFTGSRTELISLLGARTDVWVQDPASSASLTSISDLRLNDAVIIDACAGQGTKTRQLAALFPDATIIATDVERRRFEVLARAFKDHPRVRVMPFPAVKEQFLRKADLILLDVPCSNTGVLARRPEAKYRFGKDSLESVVNLQRQIIADAIPLLQDGQTSGRRGKILYSTCSLEPVENEQQAEWAAKWHRFQIDRQSRCHPDGGPAQPPTSWTDGSYAALLT